MAQVSFYKILDNQLNSLAIKEGQVIFVEDTASLYIDKADSRIKIGGVSYLAGTGINISDDNTISSSNSNLVNGSASGSLRGINSSAESGSYTIGANAIAEGNKTKASGNSAHAEGRSTKALGNFAHAEGTVTTAEGEASHAEGNGCESTGYVAHAEGAASFAIGGASHSEGAATMASGENSHSEGHGTVAAGAEQHVQGRYNIQDNNNTYAHILGNGTSSSATSNAHTIDWAGNAWFAGNIKVGGTSYDNGTSLTPGNIPVNPSDTSNLNIWIQAPDLREMKIDMIPFQEGDDTVTFPEYAVNKNYSFDVNTIRTLGEFLDSEYNIDNIGIRNISGYGYGLDISTDNNYILLCPFSSDTIFDTSDWNENVTCATNIDDVRNLPIAISDYASYQIGVIGSSLKTSNWQAGNFTVSDSEFELGMTWGEYLDSSYNRNKHSLTYDESTKTCKLHVKNIDVGGNFGFVYLRLNANSIEEARKLYIQETYPEDSVEVIQ